MRLSVKSNSTRVFVVLPAALALEQAVTRRPLHLRWAALLGWGFAQYRLAGRYRQSIAGGPSGMSQGFPDRLVTEGAYRWTRNPMYLGHLIFLFGATLVTRSPLAAAALAADAVWIDRRVRRDEQRLAERFGAPYEHYLTQVPRWISLPLPPKPENT